MSRLHSCHLSSRAFSHAHYIPALITCICIVTTFVFSGCASAKSPTTASEDFTALTEQFFHDQLYCDTVSLHYTVADPAAFGLSDHIVSLGNFSNSNPSYGSKSATDCNSKSGATMSVYDYLSSFEKIDRSTLSEAEKTDYDVLEDYLSTQNRLSEYEYYSDPLSASNGLQCELPILLAEYDFRNQNDIDEYLALLKDFPRYFDELIEYEKEKSDNGLFMSDELCSQVIDQCEKFIETPEENILISTFNARIEQFFKVSGSNFKSQTASQQLSCENYKSQNSEIVLQYVIPSYKKLIEALTSLLGTGKNPLGLSYYDDGSGYYEQLVYATTGCDDTVNDIYENIEAQRNADLQTCTKLLRADPDIINKCAELSSALSYDDTNSSNGATEQSPDSRAQNTNNQSLHDDKPSSSDNVQDLNNPSTLPNTMLETLKSNMLQDFPEPSDTTYTVSYVDESLQASLAPAFYLTAPVDDYSNNKIYINPSSEYSQIGLFTTLAHEGYPGHLYQTVMSYDYGLSPFRTLLNYGGYTEGWATYVEMMSYQYAGLDENTASFMQANHDFSLSLYATSDIGIHYYGWDYDELADFWDDYGIKDEASIKEIQSLILASPANYLKYYVGYLQFLELKNAQIELLGDDFSAKDFHEDILRIGPAPFSIISKNMQ
ncbi:DUF885 domain-containing protein [Agathobacter sp.]